MTEERKAISLNGYLVFTVLLLAIGVMVILAVHSQTIAIRFGAIVSIVCFAVGLHGLNMIQPNQAKVMTLFGAYAGTDTTEGLRWTNPLCIRKTISLRIRNFESGRLKVNDQSGSPIEIAAVIVWAVSNTAEALFEVESFESFVSIQSEAALRNLATGYPYDQHNEGDVSLRSHSAQIAKKLQEEVQGRLEKAGVSVLEARISHLAYSPEIANAMLQRQQAGAVIAARSMIVDGAVGMVEMALEKLQQNGVVELDEERKAAMVSNLLVVLCGDRNTQPVINTGSLY